MENIIGPLLTRPEFATGRWDGKRLAAENPLEALAARVRLLEQAMQNPQPQTPPPERPTPQTEEKQTGEKPEHLLTDEELADFEKFEKLIGQLSEEGRETFFRDQLSQPLQLKDLSVGDVFSFGHWQFQEYEPEKPIQWQILDKEENRVLVISRYCLFNRPYHSKKVNVTWEACDLRGWLNNTFCSQGFQTYEQKNILLTNVRADRNDRYGTDAGRDTRDSVFLLSAAEAERYFDSDKTRKGKTVGGIEESWWLRTPGRGQWRAAYVFDAGGINNLGFEVNSPRVFFARPAMWLRADTVIDRSSVERKQEVAE